MDAFMDLPILVINLASSPQRLQAITTQLTAFNLPFTRMDAVDGRQLTTAELQAVYQADLNRQKYHKQLNCGEIGCYLSHVRCWQYILEHQLPYALILEDDAQIQPELVDCLSQCRHLPQAWDYIPLSTGRRSKKFFPLAKLSEPLSYGYYRKLPSTTTAQLVSLTGAKKLLATALPIARPVDVDIQHWYEKDLRCLAFSVMPVSSGRFDSDIAKTRNRQTQRSHFWRRIWLRCCFEFALYYHSGKLKHLSKEIEHHANPCDLPRNL